MPDTADRYVRTGLDIPQIYPGDLKGITSALRDVERFSAAVAGTHKIDAVYGTERIPFRVYVGGECTYQMEQPT